MRRPEQLAELIREEVSQIVGYELDDPRVESVTVTDVRVTENLRDASVYVTAEGTESEKTAALKALKHAAPYVRRQLSILLNLVEHADHRGANLLLDLVDDRVESYVNVLLSREFGGAHFRADVEADDDDRAARSLGLRRGG